MATSTIRVHTTGHVYFRSTEMTHLGITPGDYLIVEFQRSRGEDVLILRKPVSPEEEAMIAEAKG